MTRDAKPARIEVGEPIDPEDVEPVCPRRFGLLCVDVTTPTAYRSAGGRLVVDWPSGPAQHCLISRELLDVLVADLNRAAGLQ